MGERVRIYRRVARVGTLPGQPIRLRAPMTTARGVCSGRAEQRPAMVTIPSDAVAPSGGEGVVARCSEVERIPVVVAMRTTRRPRVSVRGHPRQPFTIVRRRRRWRHGWRNASIARHPGRRGHRGRWHGRRGRWRRNAIAVVPATIGVWPRTMTMTMTMAAPSSVLCVPFAEPAKRIPADPSRIPTTVGSLAAIRTRTVIEK